LQNVGDELKPVVEAAKNMKNKKKPFSSLSTLIEFGYEIFFLILNERVINLELIKTGKKKEKDQMLSII